MGTINSNGIFIYDDTESLSPLSSYMNLQGSALSTRLAQDVRFKKVANEAARTAYVNEVGIANISAANPLAVHRQNAPEGLRFEVTYNGTAWDTIASKGYYDSQDTDWITLPVYPGGWTATTPVQARRIGSVVYFRGIIQAATSSPVDVLAPGVIPTDCRPVNQNPVFNPANTVATPGRLTVSTGGGLQYAGTLAAGQYVYLNCITYPVG